MATRIEKRLRPAVKAGNPGPNGPSPAPAYGQGMFGTGDFGSKITEADHAAKNIRDGQYARQHVGAVADGLNEVIGHLADAWAKRFAISASIALENEVEGLDYERELSFRRREKGWAIMLDTAEAGGEDFESSIPLADASLSLRVAASRQLGALELALERARGRSALELVEVYDQALGRLRRNLSPAADAK